MNNDKFFVMKEWLTDFEKDAANEEEMKEWIYILMMYLWKGETIESDNRFIRLAFNNMKNNADRIKIKQENGGKVGHPTLLPADRVYEMRKNGGMSASAIAGILTEEQTWGIVTDKQVQNSAGWKKVTAEKKTGIATSEDTIPTAAAPFNF